VFTDYGRKKDNMSKGLDDNLKKVLEAALELERKGHKYYIDISRKAENPLTKILFASLAKLAKKCVSYANKFDNLTNSGFWLDVGEFRMDARY